MVYTMDAPYFGRKMPEPESVDPVAVKVIYHTTDALPKQAPKPKHHLPAETMAMLRRVARGGKVSDASTETREQEQARRRENHAQIGQGRYGLIQPSPEDIAEAKRREALMAAGREARRREIERNTSIAESVTAAAKKLWRRA